MSLTRNAIGIVCMLCALVLSRASLAQQPSARGSADSQSTIRSYDISDLVRTNSSYPYYDNNRVGRAAVPSNAFVGGGASSSKSAGAIEAPALMELIRSTVATTTWRDNGGSLGQVRALGTILVVEQSPEAQAQIQKLLDELRKIVGPMQVMTVHATWVMVQPGSIAKTTTEATDEWMAKQKLVCESQVTCFSGQTVHISSGIDRLNTTNLTPVVASSAVAYAPTTMVGLVGMAWQITPQGVPGSEDAVVDILSIVSQQGPSEQLVVNSYAAEGRARVEGALDRLNLICQELRTTARIPMKKRIIVGGMTLNPSKADDVGQLYLVLEVSTAGN
jgi:hypothetical protein